MYFYRALDIARHQQAKSLELRVAMSLSRLWSQQGKQQEARQLLSEVYNWFSEGFDTADMQAAKRWREAEYEATSLYVNMHTSIPHRAGVLREAYPKTLAPPYHLSFLDVARFVSTNS